MSNLVDHARRELELVGEEPKTIDWAVSVVEKFEEFGHSGFSAAHFIRVLNQLLQFKNLKPLTDNPDEWEDRTEMSGEVLWQNKRNSEAFSDDGGKTYWLLSEGGNARDRSPRHESAAHE